MVKRRTIAILVAGCLVGAQAGIAANEQEITAVDTYLLVPTETVVVVEPVLIEADVSNAVTEVVVIEQAPMYIAAAEPSRDMFVDQRAAPSAALARAPIEMTFKGHPMNVSESAGPSWTGDSQQLAYQSGANYRTAHSFPMNSSETAGFTTSQLESIRIAQASTDVRMASLSSPVSGEQPKVE